MGSLERGLDDDNVSQILGEAEGLNCPCDWLKSTCYDYIAISDLLAVLGYS